MMNALKTRWAVLAVAGVANLALAGCGSTSDNSADGGESGGPEKVFYLNVLSTDSFWRAAGDGAEEAADALGVKYKELDANSDASAQASQIETAVSQGATVIVISTVDSKTVIPQLTAAQNAGITVLAITRPISDMKLDGTVATAEYDGGAAAAREMLSLAQEKGLTSMTVLQLHGAASDEAAQLRGSGFSDTLTAEAGDLKIDLVEKGTDWDLDKAANAAEDVLTTQDVDAIYAESDFLMSALTPVLERNDYTKVDGDNHALLVGVGGLPDGPDSIREGWQDATLNFPIDRQAAAAVYMGVALREGDDLATAYDEAVKGAGLDPEVTTLTEDDAAGPSVAMVPQLVTAENVDDDTLWGNKG